MIRQSIVLPIRKNGPYSPLAAAGSILQICLLCGIAPTGTSWTTYTSGLQGCDSLNYQCLFSSRSTYHLKSVFWRWWEPDRLNSAHWKCGAGGSSQQLASHGCEYISCTTAHIDYGKLQNFGFLPKLLPNSAWSGQRTLSVYQMRHAWLLCRICILRPKLCMHYKAQHGWHVILNGPSFSDIEHLGKPQAH